MRPLVYKASDITTAPRRLLSHGLESWIGVMEWSIGVDSWSETLEWNLKCNRKLNSGGEFRFEANRSLHKM